MPKEKEILEDAAPQPKKRRRSPWLIGGLVLGIAGPLAVVASLNFGHGKQASLSTPAVSGIPDALFTPSSSGAPSASSMRRDCDEDHFADCQAVPSSELKISAPGAGLDCRGGRMRRNEDKTWNVCDCPCQSQAGKN